jgi:VIT1/CCC1 family predicted Fe2+/Mn2+ transporter
MADIDIEKLKREEYLRAIENKDYRSAEEVRHRLKAGTYIGDFVYGANDGIITTFAVVAGATGAALSPGIIIILGLANLVADGFSMGASSFLAHTSERDFQRAQRKREEWEVEEFPGIEREEVRDILRKWGVAKERIEPVLQDIIKDKDRWIDLMMREELDLREADSASPAKHGTATFFAFVIAGFMPLLPYLFFGIPASWQFPVAVTATLVSLFSVGAARTLVTTESFVKSGLKMLLTGGLAAMLAYTIGWMVKTLAGIAI